MTTLLRKTGRFAPEKCSRIGSRPSGARPLLVRSARHRWPDLSPPVRHERGHRPCPGPRQRDPFRLSPPIKRTFHQNMQRVKAGAPAASVVPAQGLAMPHTRPTLRALFGLSGPMAYLSGPTPSFPEQPGRVKSLRQFGSHSGATKNTTPAIAPAPHCLPGRGAGWPPMPNGSTMRRTCGTMRLGLGGRSSCPPCHG